MKEKDLHSNLDSNDKDFLDSLPKVELPFSLSKNEVWAQMEAMMEESEPEVVEKPKAKIRTLQLIRISAAAVILVLFASLAFMRLYTKTVQAGAGEQIVAVLPDGSSIELNATSTINYKPYWWKFKREVRFEGEGFFKVQKGKSFEVISTLGKTKVLGTSFNIYARKNEYKVTCFTGKVRVTSVISGSSADISPNMQAVVSNSGLLSKRSGVNTNETISWMDGMFIFTATPIQKVLEEIERQYGIEIVCNEDLSYLYSGNFSRDRSAYEVLQMICRSLGLDFKEVNGKYVVNKK